jgi:hypothetical protein
MSTCISYICLPVYLTYVYLYILHMFTCISYICLPVYLTHVYLYILHMFTCISYTCLPVYITHVYLYILHVCTCISYTCLPVYLPYVYLYILHISPLCLLTGFCVHNLTLVWLHSVPVLWSLHNCTLALVLFDFTFLLLIYLVFMPWIRYYFLLAPPVWVTWSLLIIREI